ncbi:TIGR04255 family protein [Microbacterium sp. P07]|uniref:TIGR04255 family protein n=1 Tax=Microbacterium sp. P07 TaxID=3366952 RepID=UPI003746AD22
MPRTQGKRRLEKPPLLIALTEIRFAPILSMPTLIPEIQENLRKSGFPAFTANAVQQFQMILGGGEPTIQTTSRWVFSSADNSNAITLTTEGASVQTTQYTDFESFLKLIRVAVTVLSKVAEPSFTGRIGLRYVDAIENIADDVQRYFNESALTFSAADLGVKSLQFNQHIMAETDFGGLQIRLTQVKDSAILPPDLQTPELEDLSRVIPGTHAILDIDSSDARRTEFRWELIEERLWAVHHYASTAFWKAITDEARDIWGERVGDDE